MPRRTWDSQTKANSVMPGLQGKPIAEIWNKHQISQAQYSPWRDQFLADAATAFGGHQHHRAKFAWRGRSPRLKPLVGELTLE